jgi:hypothetical protein
MTFHPKGLLVTVCVAVLLFLRSRVRSETAHVRLPTGTRLGPYQLLGLLGAGGTGEV